MAHAGGPDLDAAEQGELPAGEFSAWLTGMQAALRGEQASDVPCGTCTACCTSSQFVHIEPDEADTIAAIPAALLFPAPGRPKGHLLLGYDERGHCPMLRDDGCSIYEHRPRTCRTYDCRVFAAVGSRRRDEIQPLIAQQVRRWRFAAPTVDDRRQQEAVAAAAAYLQEHRDRFPAGAVTSNATQLAVLAVEIHELFLATDAPAHDVVEEAVARRGRSGDS